MSPNSRFRGAVLVLPGGKPHSTETSRPWRAANLRMTALSLSLRRHLGPGVQVRQVRYRFRGWNDDGRDALRDAAAALTDLRRNYDSGQIVLVGHSMGGRVAVHLSADGDAGAVVALAPWWPRDDAALVPPDCRLRVLHGSADTWTDPDASLAQTTRAQLRGVDARWVAMPDAGHFMVRDWNRWHELTAEFAAEQLTTTRPNH